MCDDIDAILSITGHPLPLYGRISVAAYRGQVEEVEARVAELRADAHTRGEGYALTVANMSEALAYNGAGRYHEALASARGELAPRGRAGPRHADAARAGRGRLPCRRARTRPGGVRPTHGGHPSGRGQSMGRGIHRPRRGAAAGRSGRRGPLPPSHRRIRLHPGADAEGTQPAPVRRDAATRGPEAGRPRTASRRLRGAVGVRDGRLRRAGPSRAAGDR